jgi:hypothetical protein
VTGQPRLLEGWKEIAGYVEARGISMSAEQARRYAREGVDRLPVVRMGTRGKPRIVAKVLELDAWCGRFTSTVWSGDPAMVEKSTSGEGNDGGR